jgi:glycosyltransferase involved in cell wall biosynthesis
LKKVLIITYYWPPSGGIGVQRCLKFVKYLSQMGWECIVYTAKNADYPYLDESGFKDIPPGTKVLKYRIVEPFKAFKLLSGRSAGGQISNPIHVRDKKASLVDRLAIWIRGNLFIPDARALWIKPSIKFLSNYLEKHPVDAILSDGPPHTNTLIACRLSQKFGLPWLADFQDPWTQVDYYGLLSLTKRADKKHKRLEREVFNTARKITIASPTWKNDLEKIGAREVEVIYWGYDNDDYIDISYTPPEQFIISHAGLLGYDRNPETLIRVLHDLVVKRPEMADKLRLIMPGTVDYSIKESLEKFNLSRFCEYPGNLPREEILKLNLSSSVLLLPLNKADNARGRIPGKLFEYLRAHRPILCLGPSDSDVAKILEDTNHRTCFNYDDYSGLASFIEGNFNRFLENGPPEIRGSIEPFSVNKQTEILSEYLDGIINS